ncbi:hypothetical protein [Candidatus Chlamydia sanziniae]|uniref:DNA-directed DNA polymerase n=1 Tax=Candidatus Chlamydia sanziniae TaxID=1806891 RepID=A0A1A9HYV7_9CHLA|nr:hypothetical protein [Candidatus Chlamydia sanziniae]ANH79116.1 hypothetical protein Cs308_0946 [Candidatus Chlamydia sanziniae]
MYKSLTRFDDFSQLYKEKLPAIAFIGLSVEEDKDVLVEALTSGKCQEIDGSGLTEHTLALWTENYELFSMHKTVVISKVDKLREETRDFLIRYAKNPQPQLTLLLMTAKQECFRRLCQSLPFVLSLSLFREWPIDREKRLALLLSQRALCLGMNCSPSLASLFLRKLADISVHDVFNEFDQLLCRVGKKDSLDSLDIENFVTKKERVSLWKFRDALLKREVSQSHQLLHILLNERGEDPLGMIAFLRSQCLYGLRGLEETPKDSKYRLFVFYGRERLYQALSSLFYTESLIKKNIQDPVVAIETLVIKMTKL